MQTAHCADYVTARYGSLNSSQQYSPAAPQQPMVAPAEGRYGSYRSSHQGGKRFSPEEVKAFRWAKQFKQHALAMLGPNLAQYAQQIAQRKEDLHQSGSNQMVREPLGSSGFFVLLGSNCPEFSFLAKTKVPAVWLKELAAYVCEGTPQVLAQADHLIARCNHLLEKRMALNDEYLSGQLKQTLSTAPGRNIAVCQHAEMYLVFIRIKQLPPEVRENLREYIKSELRGRWYKAASAWAVSMLKAKDVQELDGKIESGAFEPGTYTPRFSFNRPALNPYGYGTNARGMQTVPSRGQCNVYPAVAPYVQTPSDSTGYSDGVPF